VRPVGCRLVTRAGAAQNPHAVKAKEEVSRLRKRLAAAKKDAADKDARAKEHADLLARLTADLGNIIAGARGPRVRPARGLPPRPPPDRGSAPSQQRCLPRRPPACACMAPTHSRAGLGDARRRPVAACPAPDPRRPGKRRRRTPRARLASSVAARAAQATLEEEARAEARDGELRLTDEQQAEFYRIQEEAGSRTARLRADHAALQAAQARPAGGGVGGSLAVVGACA